MLARALKPKQGIMLQKMLAPSALRTFTSQIECDEYSMSVQPETFKEMIDDYNIGDKVIFLDVREDEELEEGVLPRYNSEGVNLPLYRIPILDLIELQIGEIEQFKDDYQIFVYCRAGNKSVTATRLLNYHGYNTMNISGGIKKISEHISCHDQANDPEMRRQQEATDLFANVFEA
uniref:Rhodanese domain-containing protein n=1 Tax=Euplotes crassus TaxID=5936 RepID=A0A7S3KJ10_EUPCR|mmetsp:Transcript_30235/g.29728  ORF Transcript_30235/g.29728 Transcript_30235/m.29728 type:complete len:176 (+) Transcript_30235:16-543(+)